MEHRFPISAFDLPSYELDVEKTVGGDEVGDADREAAAEGVVVLGHHVGKLSVAKRTSVISSLNEYFWTEKMNLSDCILLCINRI